MISVKLLRVFIQINSLKYKTAAILKDYLVKMLHWGQKQEETFEQGLNCF